MLLALMFFLLVAMIAVTAAAPRIAQQIQRDREEELIKRGTQYARAIKRFYRKFGRYPMRLEELESTNNLRFLRRRYQDPITGTDKWRIIHLGEAKVTPKVFGPGGGTAGGGVLPGGVGGLLGQGGGQQPRSSGAPTSPGTPASQISRQIGSGQTFGGGPIVGVSSTSEKKSIKELNEKNKYNEWEFVYDPRFDVGGGGFIPGSANLPGQPQNQPNRFGPGTPPNQPPTPQPQQRPQ